MRGLILLVLTGGCLVGSPGGSGSSDVDAGGSEADGANAVDANGLPSYQVISMFGHDIVRSVTVHKNGGEDRTVYVEVARMSGVAPSGPIADGARLIMQVNAGSAFVIEKVGGSWQYGTDTTTLTTQPNTSCAGCHGGAAEPGFFTAPSLRRLIATHRSEEIICPAGPGPTPCAAAVYE